MILAIVVQDFVAKACPSEWSTGPKNDAAVWLGAVFRVELLCRSRVLEGY